MLMQEHAERLRNAQIETLQLCMEQEYHQLQGVYEERRLTTAGNLTTSSCRSKETAHKKKLRKLLAMWEYWQGVGGGAAVQACMDDILAGRFPWQPSEDSSDPSERSLRFQLFKATAELCRSSEECYYLQHDCVVARAYFFYQVDVILRWVLAARSQLSRGMAYLLAVNVSRLLSLARDTQGTHRYITCGVEQMSNGGFLLMVTDDMQLEAGHTQA